MNGRPQRGAFHGITLPNDRYPSSAAHPQPPHGRSAYNIPCPLCDRPGTREKHLNINLKRNVYRCPKCGQFQGGVFDLYAYYMGIPRDKVLEDITARLHGGSPIPSGSGGSRKKLQPPLMKPQASLAPLEERDRVYRALLSRLTLAPDHRENLLPARIDR